MGRFFLLGGVLGNVFLLGGPVNAQDLILKRDFPGSESFSCPSAPVPPAPGDEERSEAGRLGSAANQALILGDQERARDLLARATEMDPASAELAYRYARVLESLGASEDAVDQYCRVLTLGSEEEETGDAGNRLQAILDQERLQIPERAVRAFQEGLSEADQGRYEEAFRSFGQALQVAPEWQDAAFNRGIIQARMGQVEGAAADLQRYLDLHPDAPDAILVSQRLGQLSGLASLPSPSAAFSLGLLFPGAGQFYSGRAWGGLTVLTLTAGAIAAGFLIEEVTVECVGSVGVGGECPPDRYVGEEKDTPYLVHGLAAAGIVAFIGAAESFFKARGRRAREARALVGMDLGSAEVAGLSFSAQGARLHVNLFQLNF